jgi:hypothetical protein
MTQAADELRDIAMPALHWVLRKRLNLSRTWNNVEVIEKKKTFEIKWCDPKKEDPEGKETFCSRVLPLNLKQVNDEVERQHEKYREDKMG